MKQLRNTLYQIAWAALKHILLKKLSLRDSKLKDNYDVAATNAVRTVKFAKLFNINLVFLGDSNAAFGNTIRQMLGWNKAGVTANIGIAGSTFTDWVKLLKTEKGKGLIEIISKDKIPVFINLGGNHLLQNSLGVLQKDIKAFIKLFPKDTVFFAADVPEINSPIVSHLLEKSEQQINNDLKFIDDSLKASFENFVPIADVFRTVDELFPNGGLIFEIFTNVLSDGLVHYSSGFNAKYRFPYYSGVVVKAISSKV